MLNYNRKAKTVFYQILALGLGFLVLLSFLSYFLYIYLAPFKDSLWGRIDSTCGCAAHQAFLGHPGLFLFLVSAAFSLLLFFGSSLFKILKIAKSTKHFLKFILKDKKHFTSPKLKKISFTLGLEASIVRVKNDSPVIFCYGLWRPKICVSTGLIKELDSEELWAALSHEKHHLKVYEPIKLFIIKALMKILFFLPGIKPLAKQYFVLSELAADEEATNNFQNKIPLARALYKIIKWKKTNLGKRSLAVSFFSDITEERIKKLENNKNTDNSKNSYFKLAISSFFILFSLFGFKAVFSSSQPNSLSYSNNICSAKLMESKSQCQRMGNSTCFMDYSYSSQVCQ